ncbi:branched-chain amino acid ABC transporter permease [Bradyrhizobium cytisi]|uniref:Branched-chain amino acid ABC transporter permease n=1 Tax=Bradyrhizobium cytisi TaxID=515489 RepID=A0A5S4WW43_9BRAD|nr:branched-chain amino acid ABC transporter permease [Bradyrhizobium cytisi]TYL85833.1 branched-chain amino acid ABC transporter permease [Bradyrhizobium cytisi]
MTAIGTDTIEGFGSTDETARSWLRIALAVALLAGLAAVPLVANDYWLNAVLIPFLIMSLTALGLNLLMGYAGQASLGSGGFMAVGAYATYNILLRLPELPLPVNLLLGGVISGLVGVIAGLPSLRIKGFYLVASTLAAQFVLEWLFNQYGWFSNYSTSSSISAPRLAILGHDLSSPTGRYLLTLATVAIVTVVAIRLVRSQTGRTWMAIRDMDTAASVIGIPVAAGKLKAFFVSSLVIGIAGALWAFAYLGTVDARSFNLDRSFQVMFAIIIGGMGSISGNYVGAAFMILLPILLDHVGGAVFGGAIDPGQLENLQKALFGALIVWFLIKEPRGLAALLSRAWTQLASRFER